MTEDELIVLLKQNLLAAIDRDKPKSTLEFRLCAMRLAEALAEIAKDKSLKRTLYDTFIEMMGLPDRTEVKRI